MNQLLDLASIIDEENGFLATLALLLVHNIQHMFYRRPVMTSHLSRLMITAHWETRGDCLAVTNGKVLVRS